MEDYYKILNLDYKISIQEFNNFYLEKIKELKFKPFLNDDEQLLKKNLKKAHYIFNSEHKSSYDNYINNIIKFNLNKSSKKDFIDNNQITDRIFNTLIHNHVDQGGKVTNDGLNIDNPPHTNDRIFNISSNLNKSSKKDFIDNNQINDRIFGINSINNFNLEHNEMLRPKNVGLLYDN
jgi:hypothetical protein